MMTNHVPETENEARVVRAVNTLDRDIILVANAGAGKTYLLVEHYFALLESGLEPANLIAFTFTEKAANELKERIAGRLNTHPGFSGLPEDLLKAWRNKILSAPIGTIHQFCLKVIEASRRAEEKSAFKIVDEALDLQLRENSLKAFLRRCFEQEDPDAMRLLNTYGIGDLIKLLEGYLALLPLEAVAHSELPALESAEQTLLEALERLSIPLWDEIQAQKRSRAWMSFADMERRALELLQRPSESLAAFLRPYEHVLVDEFQDTAPIQIRLIEALRGSERRVKLFCVGDPKQSIYRFRDVDRNLLRNTEAALLREGGEKFDLVINYRSTPTILNLVNAFSQSPFPESRPSIAKRADVPGTCAQLSEIPETLEARNAEAWGQAEAHAVAEQIERLRPTVPLDQIAVLYRASSSVLPLIHELQARGIPYSVRGGQNLFERQEVLDLERLLYFLADPNDDLSLIGVLRSPLFLLSDATLFFLCRKKSEGSLWDHLRSSETLEALRNDYPVESEKLAWALERLQALRPLADTLSASALLERLIRRESWGSLYALAYGEPQRMLAIEQWLEWLKNAETDYAPLRLGDAVRLLKEVSALLPNKTPLGDLVASRGCVQLLTIHASKGLQFNSVFLIGMNRQPPRHSPLLLRLNSALALKVPGDDGDFHPTERYTAIEDHHALEEYEEGKRLLYVAMTRAIDRLTVMLQPQKNKSGSLQEILSASLGSELEAWKVSLPVSEQDKGQVHRPSTLIGDFAPEAPRIVAETGFETTVSELETFLTCPLKHHFAYGRQVSGSPGDILGPISATEIGTLLHAALNLLHADPDKSQNQAVTQILRAQPGIPDGELAGRLLADLNGYLQSDAYQTIGNASEDYSELPFLLKVESGALRGQIDRLLRQESGWTLIDFKYSGRPHSKRELLSHYGFQLKTYALAAEQLLRAPLLRVQIHLLNEAQAHDFRFSPEELSEHRNLLRESIHRLKAADADLEAVRWHAACPQCGFHQELPLCPVPRGLVYRNIV